MGEGQDKPQKQKFGPGMLLLLTLACIGVTVWGVVDGWFRPGYEHATFSKGVAVVAGILAIVCLVLTAKRWKQAPQTRAERRPPEREDE